MRGFPTRRIMPLLVMSLGAGVILTLFLPAILLVIILSCLLVLMGLFCFW